MTRRRVYVRAGLYAEGRSDYEFLLPLIDHLLDSLSASLFPGACEIGESIGIDASRPVQGGRAERIAAAVADHWAECTLFVIHSDGAGDPEEARRSCVEPGLAAARSAYPTLVAAACIPVREIEAWMLADAEAFRALLGTKAQPALSPDPEREVDPKSTLRRILKEGGIQRAMERHFRLLGEEVRFDVLRKLPAFSTFEEEMCAALRGFADEARQ